MLAAATPADPIYVHCEHGKDRTGLVIALYRMRADGWSQEQAAAEMKEMGHTGLLDELFTGHMDLKHVLPQYPNLAAAPPAPAPQPAPPSPSRRSRRRRQRSDHRRELSVQAGGATCG